MTLEHFYGPIWTKFEKKRKNAGIFVNSVKGIFKHSKRQISAIFVQDRGLKLCTHIHRETFFHIYSFFKFKKIHGNFWKIKTFFYSQNIFKKSIIGV